MTECIYTVLAFLFLIVGFGSKKAVEVIIFMFFMLCLIGMFPLQLLFFDYMVIRADGNKI